MTENIMEKGKVPDKAIEDIVMTNEAITTQDGAKKPTPTKWKKSQAYFERRKALARENQGKRQERRRLRKVGIEVPPRVRDPALPEKPKRNKRIRKRPRKAKTAAEAALPAAGQNQDPSADVSAPFPPPLSRKSSGECFVG